MKPLVLSFGLVCAVATSAALCADAPAQHVVSGITNSQGPVATTAMDGRLEEAAQEYAAYAPVPRIGLYDSALPADADEYKALDGFGVLLVTLVSQDKEELPPKHVYATVGDRQVELHLYKSMLTSTDSMPDVQRVLGKYRWDGIYYYPVYLLVQAQELLLDFAKNRDGFVLTRYEGEALPEVLRAVGNTPPHGSAPASPAFLKIVQREYPGLVERMDGANTPSSVHGPAAQ